MQSYQINLAGNGNKYHQKLFVDQEFNYHDRSTMGKAMYHNSVTWKRPVDICDNPKLFVEGSSRFDVTQGNFFLLSFFSLVFDLIDLSYFFYKIFLS